MNKQTIGKELKDQLSKGYDIVRISRWAFRVFSENVSSLDANLRDTLEKISAMEDDPQFELTEDELCDLANKLISEDVKKNFSTPIAEIKEIAQKLGDHWVMCPQCQETWENSSEYGMICCPKCNSKLHNPRFKPSSNS